MQHRRELSANGSLVLETDHVMCGSAGKLRREQTRDQKRGRARLCASRNRCDKCKDRAHCTPEFQNTFCGSYLVLRDAPGNALALRETHSEAHSPFEIKRVVLFRKCDRKG